MAYCWKITLQVMVNSQTNVMLYQIKCHFGVMNIIKGNFKYTTNIILTTSAYCLNRNNTWTWLTYILTYVYLEIIWSFTSLRYRSPMFIFMKNSNSAFSVFITDKYNLIFNSVLSIIRLSGVIILNLKQIGHKITILRLIDSLKVS